MKTKNPTYLATYYYPDLNKISEVLLAVMDNRQPNLQFSELGSRLGFSRQYCHRMITTGTVTTLDTWMLLCRIFDIRLSSVLFLIENPQEKISKKESIIEIQPEHFINFIEKKFQEENLSHKKFKNSLFKKLQIKKSNLQYLIERPSIVAMSAYAFYYNIKFSEIIQQVEDDVKYVRV
jgi:hypothetical protein